MQHFELQVSTGDEQRLDHFLVKALPRYTRSRLKSLIQDGFVLVNGLAARKAGQEVDPGSLVVVDIPAPAPAKLLAENIALDIVYEDASVLVVNKPAGMTVHPGAGHRTGTLVNAVLAHDASMEGVGGEQRPGVVHRLDKDTSGLIVLAKTNSALQSIQRQFHDRKVTKTYLALVDGLPPSPSGRVDAAIGRDPSHRKRMAIVAEGRGRVAISEYSTRERFRNHTLLAVHPVTGRTHQVRLHCAFLGCPVAGDRVLRAKAALDSARPPFPACLEASVEAAVGSGFARIHRRASDRAPADTGSVARRIGCNAHVDPTRCNMATIDLRSDTVTRPTPEMLEAMAKAEVGDDVYGEDPTVNRLQALSAQMMGKEAGLFVPSGTMGNLAALLAHCQRGDEVILGNKNHSFLYEAGGVSALGGIHSCQLPNEADGSLLLAQVDAAIRPDDSHDPITRLVCLENTHNRCGGTVQTADYIRDLCALAHSRGLKVHLDGARIFNAAAALAIPAADVAGPVELGDLLPQQGTLRARGFGPVRRS